MIDSKDIGNIDPEIIRERLRKNLQVDPEKIDAMMGIVKKSLVEILSDSEKALANKDMQSLSMLAHKIRGVLLNLGLNSLADEAQVIEKFKPEQGDASVLGKQLTMLRKALAPLM